MSRARGAATAPARWPLSEGISRAGQTLAPTGGGSLSETTDNGAYCHCGSQIRRPTVLGARICTEFRATGGAPIAVISCLAPRERLSFPLRLVPC